MYQCCLFDLDGTLVDSIQALNLSVNLTLERFGLEPIDVAHTKRFVGDGYEKLIERALLYRLDEDLVHYEEALKVYTEVFKEHCMYQVHAYRGIKELLEFIKQQGMKIAVLSNKPHARTIENVERIFGTGYFDLIAGEQEGVRRKPDPEGAYRIAEQLGVDIKYCLYFGDTDTDMMTGHAAGMDTVGVSWGFRGREELLGYHPEYLIDRPEEMITILKIQI